MKIRWASFKTMWGLSLSILFHLFLYKIMNPPNSFSSELSNNETLREIVADTYNSKSQGTDRKLRSISAKSLSLVKNGLRVGAFQIDAAGAPVESENPEKSQPTEVNELGTGNGIRDGKGGTWANSPTSLKLDRIAIDLHNWIDSSLYYPKELSENGIEGTVEALLYFDSTGQYQREHSRFKSNSNYLRTWISRHLKRLFKNPLPFPIGGKPLKVSAYFDFHLNLPLVLGSFQKGKEARYSRNSFKTQANPLAPRPKVSGGKLFFYRMASKNYGVGITSMEDTGFIMPVIDVLGLVDRLERVLNISKDKEHEQYALQFLREGPEWLKN